MKKKIVAALLCFFLGMLGVHRFYLGYAAIGIVQLVLTVISVYILEFDIGGLFTPALFLLLGVNIWVILDFIFILTRKIKDVQGNKLV